MCVTYAVAYPQGFARLLVPCLPRAEATTMLAREPNDCKTGFGAHDDCGRLRSATGPAGWCPVHSRPPPSRPHMNRRSYHFGVTPR